VGGYLKIAPEHTEQGPLTKMMKPGMGAYDRFKELFEQFSEEAGKKQFLIPYFIAAHPGTSDEDMMNLAIWLKRNGFKADQVQTFYPSPMATATAMYHSGLNTLKGISRDARKGERVDIVKGEKRRRLHKAFLRYHDPENWPLLREALREMGRADLIGPRPDQLVPFSQPPGTGLGAGKGRGQPRPMRSTGGGQRVNSSYSDQGGDDTGDTGTVGPGAPVITDMYMEFYDAGNGSYLILGHVVFTDDQGDVPGGKLFFTVTEGSGTPSDFSLPIVNKEDLKDGQAQAYVDEKSGTTAVVFNIGGVDIEKDYIVDGVQIKDASGNTSAEASGEVAAGSYTP